MTRLHVICEGQTEEVFVKRVLYPYFEGRGITLIPSLIGTAGKKGGGVQRARLIPDIQKRLNDTHAMCTTFIDFYGLPKDFPGKTDALTKQSIAHKAACVQQAIAEAVSSTLPAPSKHSALARFIPYVQMYEFEALLFSDPLKCAQGMSQANHRTALQNIRSQFNSPEEINDGPNTAPSKRIMNVFAGYQKVLHGELAALEIGLDVIRRECALFDAWLKHLEEKAKA